jgi:hypothetical protein
MPIDKYFSGFPTFFQLDFDIIHSLSLGFDPGFDCRRGQDFLFSKMSRPALGAHPATYSRDTEDYSPGVKRPEREYDQLPPRGVKVKNEWSYTSAPPTSLYNFTILTTRPLADPTT